ncbi:LD-carboxypeptidase [candidate division KSB1 bacterium]|nr:LD-carboxypeptidase [candidate division KSB1 bacterium]
MVLYPPQLKAGATVGIVSPSSPPSDEKKFQTGLDYLQQKGFKVVVGEHCLSRYGYLAGLDVERAEDLNQMFRNPEIDAIICSRGGYGAPRILHLIDYEAIKANPKIFVGYSDITALQQAIYAKTGLVTFSGPMVAVEMGRGIESFTEKQFWPLLTNDGPDYLSLNSTAPYDFDILKPGIAEGRLMGGCLSVLAGIIGTPYMPEYRDTILILEDIDEEPYSIDRNLSHLKAAGIFEQVRGIIFGQFLDSEPEDPSKPSLTIEQVVGDLIADLSIPVIMNYAYGHGMQKYTIPIGGKVRLNTHEKSINLIENVCC